MNYLLFNPLANNGAGEKTKDEILPKLTEKFGEFEVKSVIGLDTRALVENANENDVIVLAGGDGTLNRFANDVYGVPFKCPMYLHKAGTGNDFMVDVADKVVDDMVEINEYIRVLPKVIVNGVERRYINGIGYGLDGMCCVVADKMKEEGKTKINYTSIAIKLLLGGYKCPNAEVTVDGVTKSYKKVWIAAGMHGRYYGGGMQIVPTQERGTGVLTSAVIYGSGKLKTLIVFPGIFKGKHVKHTEMVDMRSGKDITVKFSTPMGLQIDGEVVKDVTEYRVVID